MDLSVLATPVYIASMAWENRVLEKRAAETGATPADYTKPDTTTSIAMGVASLLVPISQFVLARYVVPGKGRGAKVLFGVAASAVVVTTLADRVAANGDPAAGASPRRPRLARGARRVAAVGGVAAIAATGVLACAAATHYTSTQRFWRSGQRRDLGGGWKGWLAAMVGWDFVYYWNHRIQHEVRVLWAIHVVHHSSERYNLSTAVRQPVAAAFGVFFPYGWMARLGVRPTLIGHARGINLLYQFWIHTDTIRSLGRAEEVFNTPSHHRVHHGSNQRYLDRNHGGILIIWDRLFRTFQREDPHDPVVYGLTKNVASFNLRRVMTHEHTDIVRDVARATNWHDRLSYVVRDPGWAYRRNAETATARA